MLFVFLRILSIVFLVIVRNNVLATEKQDTDQSFLSFSELSWLKNRSSLLRLISEFSSFTSVESVCELSLLSETAAFDPSDSEAEEGPA